MSNYKRNKAFANSSFSILNSQFFQHPLCRGKDSIKNSDCKMQNSNIITIFVD